MNVTKGNYIKFPGANTAETISKVCGLYCSMGLWDLTDKFEHILKSPECQLFSLYFNDVTNTLPYVLQGIELTANAHLYKLDNIENKMFDLHMFKHQYVYDIDDLDDLDYIESKDDSMDSPDPNNTTGTPDNSLEESINDTMEQSVTPPDDYRTFIVNKTKSNYINLGKLVSGTMANNIHLFLCKCNVWASDDYVISAQRQGDFAPEYSGYHDISFVMIFYNAAREAINEQYDDSSSSSDEDQTYVSSSSSDESSSEEEVPYVEYNDDEAPSNESNEPTEPFHVSLINQIVQKQNELSDLIAELININIHYQNTNVSLQAKLNDIHQIATKCLDD